jgi:hypothetical protein
MFIQVSAIKALPAFMLQKVIDSRRDDSGLLSLSSPVQPACRPRRRRLHPRDRRGTCSAGARRNGPWRRRACCDRHRDRRINRQSGSAGFGNPGDGHDIRQLQDGVGGYHILHDALGGRKTTRRVICSDCNNTFGSGTPPMPVCDRSSRRLYELLCAETRRPEASKTCTSRAAAMSLVLSPGVGVSRPRTSATNSRSSGRRT